MHPFLKRHPNKSTPLQSDAHAQEQRESMNLWENLEKIILHPLLVLDSTQIVLWVKKFLKLFWQIPQIATTLLILKNCLYSPIQTLRKNASYLIVCTSFSSTNSSICGLKTTSLVCLSSLSIAWGETMPQTSYQLQIMKHTHEMLSPPEILWDTRLTQRRH